MVRSVTHDSEAEARLDALVRGDAAVDGPVAASGAVAADRRRELLASAEARLLTDVQLGLEAVSAVRALVDRHGDDVERAITRRVHARALAMANDFDAALVAAADAARAAEAAGDSVLAGRARMVELHALARVGRIGEAIVAGTAAHRMFVAADERELAAKADANLGEVHRLAGDPENALACFDRALPVLGGDSGSGPLENNRAQTLLDLNRFEEAEEGFERAAVGFVAAGNRVGAAIVEGNLADLSSRQGRIGAALRHFERARQFFETAGATGDLARLEAEHAELMLLRGAVDDAIVAYRSALRHLEGCDLWSETMRARVGLIRALAQAGRLDEAGDQLEVARATVHDGRATVDVEGSIAFVAGELAVLGGRPQEAIRELSPLLEHRRDRPVEGARVRHALAAALRDTGDHDRATAVLEPAIDEARRQAIRPLLAELLHARGQIHRAAGRPASAAVDLRSALSEVEAIRGSLQARRFRATFLGSRAGVHDDLVDVLVDVGDDAAVAEAFDVAVRAHHRSLLDQLAAGGGAPAEKREPIDDRNLRRRRTNALRDLEALYSRLSVPSDASATPPSGWRTEVRAAEQALRHIDDRIAAANPDADPLASPVCVGDVVRSLRAGSRLLVYHVMEGGAIAFSVGPDGIDAHRLPAGRSELADLAERVHFQIHRVLAYPPEQRDDPMLVEDARHELARGWDALVAPVADSLAGIDDLVVVPHGPLHGLPFHALHDGRRHLVEAIAVRTVPTPGLLVESRAAHVDGGIGVDRRDGGLRAAVLGAGDDDAPHIDAEVKAVAAALGGSVRVRDAQAAVADVLRVAPAVDLLHVACHGRFDDLSPSRSGLCLRDGWLTLRELAGLQLPGSIVVLSGCDTGRVSLDGSGELVGLDRVLLAAGARGIVRSLWPLHDHVAYSVMTRAYARCAADPGLDLAAAIRHEQLTMLEEHPHPGIWAALAWVGRP